MARPDPASRRHGESRGAKSISKTTNPALNTVIDRPVLSLSGQPEDSQTATQSARCRAGIARTADLVPSDRSDLGMDSTQCSVSAENVRAPGFGPDSRRAQAVSPNDRRLCYGSTSSSPLQPPRSLRSDGQANSGDAGRNAIGGRRARAPASRARAGARPGSGGVVLLARSELIPRPTGMPASSRGSGLVPATLGSAWSDLEALDGGSNAGRP